MVPMEDGLYFSSDTPLELNHVYQMDRKGNLTTMADLSSSSIYGCKSGDAIFFSTMVEPSQVNRLAAISIYGSRTGSGPENHAWPILLSWRKDRWPIEIVSSTETLFYLTARTHQDCSP